MRHLLARLAAVTWLALSAACSSAESTGSTESSNLRQLEEGVDIDQSLLEDFPASSDAPTVFASVASWSLHYVALRDPNDTNSPDPTDPFNGFFLIGNDSGGTPLFFDAIALTDEGVAHFIFSFQTDEAGSYLEIPLIAASDDSAAVATVNSTVSWLMSEKTRVGMAVGAKFAASSEDASSTIAPQDLTTWKDGLQCMADLAVLGLTITDPVAFFASEAAVDGTFAVISAVSGTGGTGNDVGGAVTNATLLGVAKGVGKAVTNAVSHGAIGADTVSALKAGGGALAAVGVAGAVGYQIYKNGVGAGLQTAINAVVPQACVSAYQNFTQVPNVTVTPTSGACMSESDCTGSLPSGTQTCADGSSAGASWLCNSGVCVIAYCASEGGTAGSSSDPSDAGAPGSEGGASSSDSGEPSYESGDAG